MLRRLHATGLLVCVLGCARANPAFDGETEASVGTESSTRPGDSGDDGGEPTSESDDDDSRGDASSTAATTAPGDDESTGKPTATSGTTDDGGSGCSVAIDEPFALTVYDDNANPFPFECGRSTMFVGPVAEGSGGDTLVLGSCEASGCRCPGETPPVMMTFTDLDPTPPDTLDASASECIAVTVYRAPLGEGCGVEAIIVENVVGDSDFPLYIASNGFGASNLSLPPITLHEPDSVCEEHSCVELAPGEYALSFGDQRPIPPGDSAEVTLDPYASVEALYEVFALYAWVDEACSPHIGWVAAVAG